MSVISSSSLKQKSALTDGNNETFSLMFVCFILLFSSSLQQLAKRLLAAASC